MRKSGGTDSPQLGRNRLQGTRQDRHDQQVPPQIATGIGVEVPIAHRERERPEGKHDERDVLIKTLENIFLQN